jgi:hypothetical protein
MNTQELDKLTKYYMGIIQENKLMFKDYELKCWQQAYKDMEKKYDKNLEDGNKSR